MDELIAPLIVFLIFVAPLWIILHYRHVNKSHHQLSENELQAMERMMESFDKMAERIETLEAILDQEHDKWRDHVKKD